MTQFEAAGILQLFLQGYYMNSGLNKSFTASNPVTRIANAFKYSKAGLKSAIATEAAFRQDLFLFAVSSIIAFVVFGFSLKFFVILNVGILLLIAELINTAIEYVVDRIGTERHELSGKAKDVGSAIVLLTFLILIVTWISAIIF